MLKENRITLFSSPFPLSIQYGLDLQVAWGLESSSKYGPLDAALF